MSRASTGACMGHYPGHAWGIIRGMTKESSGACLGHHLGHAWVSSGSCLGHHLGHVFGMSGASSKGMFLKSNMLALKSFVFEGIDRVLIHNPNGPVKVKWPMANGHILVEISFYLQTSHCPPGNARYVLNN